MLDNFLDHTRIAPDNLLSIASIQMAQAMLAAEKIPEEVKALIVKKAEGSPFFVEEVVKSLQEIGVLQRVEDGFVLAKRLDSIFVPDTIQDVIMARMDRRVAYQKARQVVERVRANLQNPSLRMSLERSPIIQQIYDFKV